MRIGIILHPYDEDKPAGLARTIFEWTKGMLSVDEKNEYIVFLKNVPRKDPDLPGKNWRVESTGGGIFWLDNLRKRTICDVYLFNTPVLPLFYRPQNTIVLALDFAYYYLAGGSLKSFLQKWGTFLYHKWSLYRADRVIAISQATKKDVVKLFKYPTDKITVVYLGYKKICSEKEIPIPLPQKFFFFAGIIKERKNVLNLIRAFDIFAKKNREHSLVIGGNPSGEYFEKVRRYVIEHGLGKRVLFAGHLNDGQLSYVYRRATVFIFPTLIEGFGMPVLEAMDCGVPVITSNQSSLKEVGGNNSALLINPYIPAEIAGAMDQLVRDENQRANLIIKGKEQAKLFSWDIAAKELLHVIKKLHE